MILDPTLSAIDRALVERDNEREALNQRGYLGASGIGRPCARELWYGFRWAVGKNVWSAYTLKIFNEGHRSEDAMAEMLRMVKDIELYTEDPKTQKQIAVSGLSGHFAGHMDGVIRGLLHDPSEWYIWEHKSTNSVKFDRFRKLVADDSLTALSQWDWTYYCQAQIYMGMNGKIDSHYITVSTPGCRDFASTVTRFSQEDFEKTLQRARDLIEMESPPPKISDDANYYMCKECKYKMICHFKRLPEVNCRTCAHATPEIYEKTDSNYRDDAPWHCRFWGNHRSFNEQKVGCDFHVYIPTFLEMLGEPVEYSNDTITYALFNGATLVNGIDREKMAFLSREIYLMVHESDGTLTQLKSVDRENIDALRRCFGAEVAK